MSDLLSVKPSEPVILDRDELRKLAQAALGVQEREYCEPITEAEIELNVLLVEKDILQAAVEGNFDETWVFKTPEHVLMPYSHYDAICETFRQRHPKLMMIVNRKSRSLRIEWK